MAQFLTPWNVKKDGSLDERELARALRQSIASEHEAVHLYESYADATDNYIAKKVFQDIADEEKVHVGEFMSILNRIQPDEEDWLKQGQDEVEDMAADRMASISRRVAFSELKRLNKNVSTTHGFVV